MGRIGEILAGLLLIGLMLNAQVHVEHGYLGVAINEIDSDRAKVLRLSEGTGVEITNVLDSSPAQRAGLKPGDVLLSFNGVNLLGEEQLMHLVMETPPGRKVKLQYWRAGKKASSTVTTGSLQAQGFESSSSQFLMAPLPLAEVPTALIVWRTPSLGVECEPLGQQLAVYFGVKYGVLIRAVDQGSPAEKVGLKAGDILTGIGDGAVLGPRDIATFFRHKYQQGKAFSLTLTRRGKGMTLSIPDLEGQD